MNELVLSLFHGIDLFGRGFEQNGFCVVRAAELDLGFDIRDFTPPRDKFDGIIAGSPCNHFSVVNRTREHIKDDSNCNCPGCQLLAEFCRVVEAAAPDWFVLENVPSVPNVKIPGFSVQRFDLNAAECNLNQSRLRHFQFGSKSGKTLTIERSAKPDNLEPCALASEGKRAEKRSIKTFARLQGLPENFDLPYFRIAQKYKVIGQGVAIPMASRVAKAVRDSLNCEKPAAKLCKCGCGRVLTGKQKQANPACRKREQLRRDKLKRESAIAEN